MRQLPKTLPLLLFCSALSTGCALIKPEPEQKIIYQVRVQKPDIPADLLVPPKRPAIPEICTQRDAAILLVQYDDALSECTVKLDSVSKILNGVP